jgi:TPR repeat protein
MKEITRMTTTLFYIPLTLSVALLSLSTTLNAETKLASIATVHLNNPPPPWEVRPSLADQTVNSTRSEISVEAWYRNRQKVNNVPHLNKLEIQARKGDRDAQYQLGLSYYSGSNGHKFDRRKAVQWLSQAAKQGHSDAQYSLGLLHSNNYDAPQSQSLAVKWLKAAAKQGHIAAKLALINTARPKPQALKQVPPIETKTQLDNNFPKNSLINQTASISVQEKIQFASVTLPEKIKPAINTSINLAFLKEDAEAGDRSSQLLLGSLYEEGKQNLQKNLKKAAQWYRKAADQGDAQAQYNLGLLYEEGKGMPQDYYAAAQWYQLAVDESLSEAQNNLGVLYILGKGVMQNKSKAESLFRIAAGQGNSNAIQNLNLLLN